MAKTNVVVSLIWVTFGSLHQLGAGSTDVTSSSPLSLWLVSRASVTSMEMAASQAAALQKAVSEDRTGTLLELFEAWSRTHRQTFAPGREYDNALAAFSLSVDRLVATNLAVGSHSGSHSGSHWASLNQFSASSPSEIKARLGGGTTLPSAYDDIAATGSSRGAGTVGGSGHFSRRWVAGGRDSNTRTASGSSGTSDDRDGSSWEAIGSSGMSDCGDSVPQSGDNGAWRRRHRQLAQTTPPSFKRFVNWTATGRTTPVKEQGKCGCCWAMMAMSAVEAALAIAYPNSAPTVFSSQMLVSCVNSRDVPWIQAAYDSFGCSGGRSDFAIAFMAAYSMPLDAAYPFVSPLDGNSGACRRDMMTAASDVNGDVLRQSNDPPKLHASGGGSDIFDWIWGVIGRTKTLLESLGYYNVNYVTTQNETALMQAVMVQPVVCYWSISTSFIGYGGGVFYGAECASCTSADDCQARGVLYLAHALLVVGYDADQRLWIVQNGWGTHWGEQGHARVRMTGTAAGACHMYTRLFAPSLKFAAVPDFIEFANGTDAPLPEPDGPVAYQPLLQPLSPSLHKNPPPPTRRRRSPGQLTPSVPLPALPLPTSSPPSSSTATSPTPEGSTARQSPSPATPSPPPQILSRDLAPGCPRPRGWCNPPVRFLSADCDGDGVLDLVCVGVGIKMLLSGSGRCVTEWPPSPKEACPALF